MPGYDVAIIGLGAMGSFTALELAGRGASVIGFDRFSPPHEKGSHGGETRAFRTIYTEHPDYVPLMKRALEHWERLAADSRPELLTWTGVLSLGEAGSPLLEGIRQSAAVYGLPVQSLSADEVRRRFPALNPPGNFTGLLDGRAGLIDVAAALGSALQGARNLGAELRLDQEVQGWSVEGREVQVSTRGERIRAKRLVVAAGAWSGAIL
ncbi:MAG: FAD-dependent oxidoreductase, partial [Acidobacteria bacterium]|nr:FAD-dependent oxidoreductase [Acidobacteriota bacterium]